MVYNKNRKDFGDDYLVKLDIKFHSQINIKNDSIFKMFHAI